MEELDGKIEAILFASGDYVTVDKLVMLTGQNRRAVKASLDRIQTKFEHGSFNLMHENDGWKFHVKNEHMEVVQNIIQNTELTKAVMETLAVIAWKTPILQSDLIKIRTNKAYDHIAELVEKQFVTKEKSGRTYILKLTQKFFEYFDIGSRDEIKNIFEDIEDKPKNVNIIPQRKVIDFDGTPRTAAKIKEASKLEVYDVEEEKRQEQERRHAQALHIQNMRGDHKSF